jgi:hypothetical protein
MTTVFRKFILGVLIAALAIAALPFSSVFAAAAQSVAATPPAPRDPALASARLELVFATQKYRVEIIGLSIDNADILFKRAQMLIDKARSNGKDVFAVQAAFDVYKAAFEKGKPLYTQAKVVVDMHAGFDDSGKLIDTEKAKATVKSLGDFIKQYRDTVGEARKALREAIQAFRQANPRSTPIPIPADG